MHAIFNPPWTKGDPFDDIDPLLSTQLEDSCNNVGVIDEYIDIGNNVVDKDDENDDEDEYYNANRKGAFEFMERSEVLLTRFNHTISYLVKKKLVKKIFFSLYVNLAKVYALVIFDSGQFMKVYFSRNVCHLVICETLSQKFREFFSSRNFLLLK